MSTKKAAIAIVFTYVLASGISYSANQPYILSYSTGTTVVLQRITRTDNGIQTSAPVFHNLNRSVGATALDVIIDAAGTLRQVNVYVTFVGSNNLPSTSLLTFNAQLQSPNSVFVSETPLPKLKLGQFQPLRLFQAAGTKRLFAAGPVQTQFSNDYFGYNLDASGIATGSKRTIFQNPNNDAIFGGAISPSGAFASQFVIRAVKSMALNLASSGFSLAGNLAPLEKSLTFVKLSNGDPTTTKFTWTNQLDGYYSPRCSNPITTSSPGGRAAASVVYHFDRNFRNGGTPNAQSQIRIWEVDATTATPLSAPRPLTNFVNAPQFANEIFQSISAAPDGGLVLYTVYSNACKKMILKGQRLSNGQKVGGAKIILNCNQLTQTGGVYGINIDPAF